MKDVDPRFRQRNEPCLHLLGRGRKPCGVILEPPLRDPQNDRKLRSDGRANSTNQFGRESRPLGQCLPSVGIATLIRRVPEELVNQVAMGSMNFDRVKSQGFGICRRIAQTPGSSR